MIVTAKHKSKMEITSKIEIGSQGVEVTDSFKLLGVQIDNELTFKQHFVNICKNVNKKLFSILNKNKAKNRNLFFQKFSLLNYFIFLIDLHMFRLWLRQNL